MALIKKHMTKFGIEADYWRVEMVTLNYNKQMVEVNFSLHLYFNKEATEFIESYGISDLMGNQNPDNLQLFIADADIRNIRKVCYEYAKAHVEFFIGAVDDPDEVAIKKEVK